MEALSTADLAALAKQRLTDTSLTADALSEPLLLLAERDPLQALDLLLPHLDGDGAFATACLEVSRMILSSLLSRQPSVDDAMLEQLMSLNYYSMRAAVVAALAESQPERAMGLWQNRWAAGHREETMFHDLSAALLTARRFDLFAALLDSLPAAERNKWTSTSLFDKLHLSQMPEAIAFQDTHRLPPAAWQSLARRYGALDADAAIAWALTRTGEEQARIMTGLTEVQEGHPERFRQWLAAQPSGPVRSIMLGACLSQIPFTEALAILQSEPALPGDIPNLTSTMSGLILRDLPAAEQWIAALPEGAGKEQLQARLAHDWAGKDPAGWLNKIAALPDSPDKEQQVRAASRRYASVEPDAWLTWTESLDPDTRRELLDADMPNVCHLLPAHATAVAAGLIADGQSDYQPQFEQALKAWAGSHFAAAATWSASSAPMEARDAADRVIESVRKELAEDAARWQREKP